MQITADITWPEDTGSHLPLPYCEFSGVPRNASIVSEKESPRISRRSRFQRQFSSISVRWVLTEAELADFETFYDETLGNGVACFSIDLRYPRNSELTPWLVRFDGGYQITKSDGLPVVEATLNLINPMTVADAAS